MLIWLTLLASFVMIAVIFLVLFTVKTPSYRLQRRQVENFLQMVLDGSAKENDWMVFTAVPLAHDPQLESVRLHCLEIEEKSYLGHTASGHLLSREGLADVAELLHALTSQH